MDNRLTKKRLSDFLAYEWILTIIAAIGTIIIWELVYTVSAVRLTTGQSFKYYYDETVTSVDGSAFYNTLIDGGAFSYDVKELASESLSSEYNVLTTRLSVYEGDVIFTDCTQTEEDSEVRAKTLVDSYGYNYERLLSDAEEYLSNLKTDGKLDEAKIQSHFNERSDKRVYKNALKAGEISVQDEIDRIKKLEKDVEDFKKILSSDAENLFFRYTRYEQTLETADDKSKQTYETLVEKEKQAGRENAIYGLNLGALKNGKTDVTAYVKLSGTTTADGVTLLVFDFKSEQEDLQFEAIGFINCIVRNCSDILS